MVGGLIDNGVVCSVFLFYLPSTPSFAGNYQIILNGMFLSSSSSSPMII